MQLQNLIKYLVKTNANSDFEILKFAGTILLKNSEHEGMVQNL